MAYVLVTGGSGFVGSHLVEELLENGHRVRVLDVYSTQVHGSDDVGHVRESEELEVLVGDVRDRCLVRKAVDGVEYVFHLAASVGVGQSMYEIADYVSANSYGAAVLLDVIVNDGCRPKKMVVASSMSVYGEGLYECERCGKVSPELRSRQQLEAREWEMCCPLCSGLARILPTPEDKALFPASIYAITKRDHEEMFLSVGRAYDIPTIALRYFNIYGPRQSLSNPYTGVMAIFSSRFLNMNSPFIFEDGGQKRDFIHVNDIVRANLLAMTSTVDYGVFNVGTGRPLSVGQVADILRQRLAPDIQPIVEDRFRAGDIRHCIADTSRARQQLGFTSTTKFEEGINSYLDWVQKQMAEDRMDSARNELIRKGLII